MSTQVFETLIEFAGAGGAASGTAATGDPAVIAALAIALALAAAGCALVIARRRAYAAAADGSSAVPSSMAWIAPIAAIALAALLAVGMLLPSGRAFAAAAGRDVGASVPSKVTATVGADGSVAVASGTIGNSDDVLAIGVRKVATASTADLGNATLKLSIGGTEVYSGAVGGEVVIDDYAVVAKGASAEMAFELSMPAERALALAGTSPITVRTTVDAVSSPAGKLVYGGSGNPVAGAKATASWTDPYTDEPRTYETTTDGNGSYALAPMKLGTSGTVSFTTEAGPTAEAPFTADEGQHVEDAVLANYLTFTAQADNSSVTPKFKADSSWQYSTDGGENWAAGSNAGTKIDLAKTGDSVKLKGEGCTTDPINNFTMTGSISASGSVTSLTDGAGADPAVALTNNCYGNMFLGCTSLASAPELPATTLADNCYNAMFLGCTSLAVAPSLPATTLATNCYGNMFQGCTSLASAPELPATTLARYCYSFMFSGCASLASAPALAATVLKDYCYNAMFSGCTALKVSENDAGTEIFTCPSPIPNNAVTGMFLNTGGSFTGTPAAGKTYCWYTES